MADTREKLIELLTHDDCPNFMVFGDNMEGLVDYLIANGVTVQQWIPVTERVPDESIPSQHYLCWYKGRVRILKYWRTRKCFESNKGRVANVTHWMPLPGKPEVEK